MDSCKFLFSASLALSYIPMQIWEGHFDSILSSLLALSWPCFQNVPLVRFASVKRGVFLILQCNRPIRSAVWKKAKMCDDDA